MGGFEIGEQNLDKDEHHGIINKLLGTDVILLCFSIDNLNSFENVSKQWVHRILNYYISLSEDNVDCSSPEESQVNSDLILPIIILVGCKGDKRIQKPVLDAIEARRQYSDTSPFYVQDNSSPNPKTRSIIATRDATKISKALRAYTYMECCSRWGTGINEIFDVAIKSVLERREYISLQRFV